MFPVGTEKTPPTIIILVKMNYSCHTQSGSMIVTQILDVNISVVDEGKKRDNCQKYYLCIQMLNY